MKTLSKWSGAAIVVALASLMYSSCTEPEVTPDDDGGNSTEITKDEADAFMDVFSFHSSNKINGAAPSVTNSSLAKMNGGDTVYLVRGVKMPIRISFPPTAPPAGVFIYVKNSTYYYDVPVIPEEESDSTGTIYFEFDDDDDGADEPVDFPIKVLPHDDDGTPLDIIERMVEIEPTKDPECPITYAGWYWISTTMFNHAGEVRFENFPGRRFKTSTTYEGCCVEGTGQNCPLEATTLNAEVDVDILYRIMSETFFFNTDKTYVRRTHEYKKNFDPTTTLWCFGEPGYMEDHSHVTYTGTHDFEPGANQLKFLSSTANCDLCGYGSPGGGLIYSCHNMIIISGSPAEGSTQIRVYKARFIDEWND